jgi:integrase
MSVRKRTWSKEGEGAPIVKESWIVDYVDQEGDRHIKSFARKKEADAYHDSVRSDVRKGMHVAPSKSITVEEAANNWIKAAEARDLERATLLQYRDHLRLHINPKLGKIKLANLTRKRVEQFRDQLLENGGRVTAKKVLTSLKSILRGADYPHVVTDVSIRKNKRELKIEAGRDFPTTGEIKRLIGAAENPKRRTLLLMAALTGLRASELRGLRWADIDLKACELQVRQRADRYNAIGAPKSGSSVRTIPLPQQLLSTLKAWKLACPTGAGDLVFPTATGAAEYHTDMLRSMTPIMAKAGVVDKHGQPKYALHAFRHFFASWCINPVERGGRGLPAKVVQQLLGHSSIVLTMDTYGHLFPAGDDREELTKAAAALLG